MSTSLCLEIECAQLGTIRLQSSPQYIIPSTYATRLFLCHSCKQIGAHTHTHRRHCSCSVTPIRASDLVCVLQHGVPYLTTNNNVLSVHQNVPLVTSPILIFICQMSESQPSVVTVAAPSVREGVTGVGESITRLLNTPIIGPLNVRWLLIILLGFMVFLYIQSCARCQAERRMNNKGSK